MRIHSQDDDKIVLATSLFLSIYGCEIQLNKMNKQTDKSVCVCEVKFSDNNDEHWKVLQFNQFRAFKWFLSLHSRYTHTHPVAHVIHDLFESLIGSIWNSRSEGRRERERYNYHGTCGSRIIFCKSVYFWSNAFFSGWFIKIGFLAVANCNLSIHKCDDWLGVNWFSDVCCDSNGLDWNMTQYNTIQCENTHKYDFDLSPPRPFLLQSFAIQTLL